MVTQIKLSDEMEAAYMRTTHTVLKRLCDKGLFQNQKGTVTSLTPRSQFYSMQSQRFVEDAFGGSLLAFIATFTKTAH